MIAIIDYGVGNVRSVEKALNALGFEAQITDNIKDIDNASGLILPGVGAFRDAISKLNNSQLTDCIKKNVYNKKPLLGICLGMQLLYDKSYEDGEYEGLGIISGDIVKFNQDVKIPHMGWNKLYFNDEDPILKYIKEESYVYFVHSYYAKPYGKEIIAYTDYGVKVPAIVKNNNVYGMQFHPEKSGEIGLNLLKAFGEMVI
ncbi:imidazole glycerol phosphate synthase subunit HisH [Clostridiisalibacter paucivorans]|uniref:imidazole glycerol phosphate synthase subunit HisH n=1 Tax=Clostridiisalibacter paucivorans TaxID=408753 RepID=UPI00047DEC81|nr:imidazole glycerol phosphate synthase subunit HisH [Clostridiisalibacter paucivorans]